MRLTIRRWPWWIPAIYLGLSVAFFLPAFVMGKVPLPLENAYSYPDPYWAVYRPPRLSSPPNFTGVDITNYWYPYMHTVVGRLQQGEIPLWNPQIYSGMPLLGVQQAAVLYPLNLLFSPLGPNWIWPATAIVRLFLMGWGLHLLMRCFNQGHIAAFWAGVTYQFCGNGIAYLHWANHNVLAFLPLALYATDRLIQAPRGRWFLLLAASLAFQFLGGHPETSVLFALVWGSFTLVRMDWRRNALRSWLLLGAAVVAALGLVLPQLLPAIDLIPESVTFQKRRTPEFLAQLNQGVGDWHNLRQWTLIVNPYIYGTPLGNRSIPPYLNYHLLVTYLGVLTVPWVLAGMLGGQPRRMAVYWTGVALLSLCLTYVLPGFDRLLTLPVLNLSIGSRFNQSWSLAAAVLAGFGVERTLRGSHKEHWFVIAAGTLCLLVLGWSVYDLATASRGSWILNGIPGPDAQRRIAAFYNRNSVQLLGLLLSACLGWIVLLGLLLRRKAPIVASILLAITYVELLFHGVPFNGFADPRAVYPPTKVTRALHASDGHFRISNLDGAMDLNTSMTQNLEHALGYDDLVAFRYNVFAGRSSKIGIDGGAYVIQPLAQRFFDLANVKYLITIKPVGTSTVAGKWPLFTQDGPIHVYQNPTVLPRAYVVPSVRTVEPDQAIAAVYEPDFDPRREAIIEEPLAGSSPQPDAPLEAMATIVGYEPERVAVEVALSRAAFLVLSDSYARGWHATVDGKPVHIYRANAVYRGVALPAGQHHVVFTYRPASWVLGTTIALVTLALCIAGCWWARYRRQHR